MRGPGSRRTAFVLGGFRETGLAGVSRSGQRWYWHCSEHRSVWRETPRGEAVEGSGFRSAGGYGESRRKHVSRRLYVRFRWAVYVLHCFQKKSHRGIRTPKPDVELVLQRLRLARQDHGTDMAKANGKLSGKIVRSSGNVFADLGFADAGERQTKVRLAIAINGVVNGAVIASKAAELLGINQPKVSALAQYRLEGFSVERLMRFLTSLNQDV